MDDRGGTRTLAVGLIIGALIGAGVALLVAPQSGEETRRLLRRKARRLAAEAQDHYEDAKDRVARVRRRAEESISG